MNNMIRSTWLRSILLFTLALSASNCGDESEVIIEAKDCDLSIFEEGLYTFTVDEAGSENILCDQLLEQFVSPTDQFSVVLPGVENLPPTIDIPFGEPIGTVTVDITTQGNRIWVTTPDPITIITISGSVTGTVSGSFCPIEAGEVLAGFTFSVTSPFPCDLLVGATGRQT